MKIERFEDCIAWQKANELCILVYETYRPCKDYSFRDQIQRAAVSSMNNIAEGFERNTNKELTNFLYIAKGSAGEVRSMVYLSQELKLIDQETNTLLTSKCEEVSKILSGLIKTL